MASAADYAVIYTSSHHGNTLLVAQALAEELHADLLTLDQAKGLDLGQYQMIGFGSGIYFGRHSSELRLFTASAASLPVDVFLYSTAGLPFLMWWQHHSLRASLIQRGCRIMAEFSCRGWDTVGPLWLLGGINRKHPNHRDLERAREFARGLEPKRAISVARESA